MSKKQEYERLQKVSEMTLDRFDRLDRPTQLDVIALIRAPVQGQLARAEREVAESRAQQFESMLKTE